jgi:hypothetical protein
MMIIIIINLYEYLTVVSADILKESAGSLLSVPLRLRRAFKFSGFPKRQERIRGKQEILMVEN